MEYKKIARKRKIWSIISIIAIFIILTVNIWKNNCNVQSVLKKPVYITDTVKIEKFSENNLIRFINLLEIKHPNIVLNQAKLETGNFTSPRFIKHNALFGFQISDTNIIKYKSWKESVIAYKCLQMRKLKRNEDYYHFLVRIKYSVDSEYINKLKQFINA